MAVCSTLLFFGYWKPTNKLPDGVCLWVLFQWWTRISKQGKSSQSFWPKCNEICETDGETYTSRESRIDIYPEALAKPCVTMVNEHSARKRRPNCANRANERNMLRHPSLITWAKEMLADVGSKVWLNSNFTQHVPTSCHIAQHGVQTITTCCTQQWWVVLCKHVAFV